MIKKRLEASVQSNRNILHLHYLKEYFLQTDYCIERLIISKSVIFTFNTVIYSIKQIIMCSPMLNFSQSFTFKSIPKCFHKKEERERERKSAEVF